MFEKLHKTKCRVLKTSLTSKLMGFSSNSVISKHKIVSTPKMMLVQGIAGIKVRELDSKRTQNFNVSISLLINTLVNIFQMHKRDHPNHFSALMRILISGTRNSGEKCES